jgi:hypothetical protein
VIPADHYRTTDEEKGKNWFVLQKETKKPCQHGEERKLFDLTEPAYAQRNLPPSSLTENTKSGCRQRRRCNARWKL